MDGIDFVFNFDYDDICMIMKDVLENCSGKKFKENLTKIQKIHSHLSLDTIFTNLTNFMISESTPFPKWAMGYSQITLDHERSRFWPQVYEYFNITHDKIKKYNKDMLEAASDENKSNEIQDGNVQGASGVGPVEEYIDSIEVENRCLKVSQEFYQSLEKDNQQLKKTVETLKQDLEKSNESKLCKICMDAEICIAFVPCGHIVSCAKCSPSIKNCAVCRKPIQSTMKTYFS